MKTMADSRLELARLLSRAKELKVRGYRDLALRLQGDADGLIRRILEEADSRDGAKFAPRRIGA